MTNRRKRPEPFRKALGARHEWWQRWGRAPLFGLEGEHAKHNDHPLRRSAVALTVGTRRLYSPGMAKITRVLLFSGLLFVLATGCGALSPIPISTQTPLEPVLPTLVPTSIPQPTITPLPPDTGWQTLYSGVEVRGVNVPADQGTERVTVARMDPMSVTLRVFYTPGIAYPASVWARRTGALLVINGGYFADEAVVTGLTIVDGLAYGTPYEDYAGMFAVGADGGVSVRWLRTWPYDPGEGLLSAVQSFPVLVKPGGEMGFPADADDGRTSRRTVVAQDRQGRLLFLIAPRGYLSLHALAVWLTESDLDVDVALNLDGGTSSGFWMAGGPQVESLISVPAVIGVFAR